MQLSRFMDCVQAEFGVNGSWILDSHVLPAGATAEELMRRGVPLREVWLALCEDFEVPEARRLGPDE